MHAGEREGGREEERESSGSKKLRLAIEHNVDACIPPGAKRGQRLGSGSFGIVYALDPKPVARRSSRLSKKSSANESDAFRNHKWVLKASLIDTASNRDTFEREIYFLEKLGKLNQSMVPKLMTWNTTCASGRIGIQVIERFDSSAKDLLKRQAKEFRLGRDDWAIHLSQLRQIIKLGHELDALGIIHGDAKLANMLCNADGSHIVWADFGFTGRRVRSARAQSVHYNPLMGFTRGKYFKCPGATAGEKLEREIDDIEHDIHTSRSQRERKLLEDKKKKLKDQLQLASGKQARLARVPPHSLWTRWNSIQLFFNLLTHSLYLIPTDAKIRKNHAKSAKSATLKTKVGGKSRVRKLHKRSDRPQNKHRLRKPTKKKNPVNKKKTTKKSLSPTTSKSKSRTKSESFSSSESRTSHKNSSLSRRSRSRTASTSRSPQNRYVSVPVLSSLFKFDKKLLDEMVAYCPGTAEYLK